MTAERVSPIIPAGDFTTAVDVLATVLGRDPTFVDGDRWAQFDAGGSRVMLAGSDRETNGPSLAVKVGDLDATLARLHDAGVAVGPPTAGPHERRAVIPPSDAVPWAVVLYQQL